MKKTLTNRKELIAAGISTSLKALTVVFMSVIIMSVNARAQRVTNSSADENPETTFAVQKNPVQVAPVKNTNGVIPGIPFCPTISSLTTIDYSYDKVILGWNPSLSFDSIMFRYALNGSTSYRTVTIPGTPNPGFYIIEGLAPVTTYDFEVSTRCHTGAVSPWTAPITITTFDEPTPRLANQRNTNMLRINPNPATTITTISFSAPVNSTNQVMITSPAGRSVFKTSVFCADGKVQMQVDVSNITPGLYIVKVSNSQGMSTERLIVQ